MRTRPGTALAAEPYLHVGDDRIYNPLTDATLGAGEPGYAELRALLSGSGSQAEPDAETTARLRAQGWLVEPSAELDARFLLRYVSLEAHTVCNHACYFCPVSLKPRPSYFMPSELFADVVQQLAAFAGTIEGVFLNNYNEPTVDKRFLDQVAALRAAGLPVALLSNASGLTPDRVDALVAGGGLAYFSVNLSTIDRQRFARERGVDQLPLVLRHLDYLKDQPLAERMEIVVLGTGDERHRGEHRAVRERFAGSRLVVRYEEVMDRAGHVAVGRRPEGGGRLAGCENMGSRPLQHLHVTPQGRCLLCCEDYDEEYVVGDLTTTPLREVLTGVLYRQMRRWSYGCDPAPERYLCTKCVFALRR